MSTPLEALESACLLSLFVFTISSNLSLVWNPSLIAMMEEVVEKKETKVLGNAGRKGLQEQDGVGHVARAIPRAVGQEFNTQSAE